MRPKQELEVSMFSSLAVIICFVAGTAIVVMLSVRGVGRPGDSIARVLYDAEHPEKTR
jgi:hypothetical protein